MPKQIQFEGTTHTFPDDFTDAEIQSALTQAHPPQGNLDKIPLDKPVPGIFSGDEQVIYPGETATHAAGRTAVAGVMNIPKGLYNIATHPVKFARTLLPDTGDERAKGTGPFREEDIDKAPVMGDPFRDLTEKAKTGSFEPIGEVGGAYAMGAGGKALLGKVGPPVARRLAQSMIGPEAKGTPSTSRPADAIVAEGPVSMTRKGLTEKLQERTSGYNQQIEDALAQSRGSAPEDLHQIVRRAAQPEIDRAANAGRPTVANAISKWVNDYLANKPQAVELEDLHGHRKALDKDLDLFKGEKATSEDIGLDEAQRQVRAAMNDALDRRINGYKAMTQRESGLIRGSQALAEKTRIEEGGPVMPGPTTVGGKFGFTLGALELPEILPKTLAIKLLGDRVPLDPLTPSPVTPIRGLLGPGAVRMGSPVQPTGPAAPAPYTAPGTRATRLNLLLPERGTTTGPMGSRGIEMPPIPDESEVSGTSAKYHPRETGGEYAPNRLLPPPEEPGTAQMTVQGGRTRMVPTTRGGATNINVVRTIPLPEPGETMNQELQRWNLFGPGEVKLPYKPYEGMPTVIGGEKPMPSRSLLQVEEGPPKRPAEATKPTVLMDEFRDYLRSKEMSTYDYDKLSPEEKRAITDDFSRDRLQNVRMVGGKPVTSRMLPVGQ